MNARILRNRPTFAAIITLTAGAANAQSVLSASLIAPLQDMLSLHAVGVAGSGADSAVAYQALHLDGSSSVGLHSSSGFSSLPGSHSSGSSLSQFRYEGWSWGLSQTGSMAGSSGSGHGRATLWTLSSGSPPELHLLDDGSSSSSSVLSSVARAVSLDGQRAVGSVVRQNDGMVSQQAVVWLDKSSPTLALRLADGFDSSDALACDATGSVVAGFVSSSSTGSSRAALWSGDSLHLYGGPDNDCDGRFVALSNDASAALYVGSCDASGSSRAVSAIFRPSTGTWFTLPGRVGGDCDDTNENAFAMSADGRVVGGSSVCADGSSSATFWTFSNDAYVARDLSLVVAASSFADQFAGVSLLSITGVSSDGLTFVGNAVDSTGASMMFRVTVPTPGSAALLGMAGLLTARRRRH